MDTQTKELPLRTRVAMVAAYILMNSGIVLIVRSFPGLYLCPMSAFSDNVIDFHLCLVTSQTAINAFFTTLKTEPGILAGYTGLSVAVQQAFWHISKNVRAAKLEIK